MNGTSVDPSDVLNGYKEIATFLRISVGQAKHRVAIGAIPTFKIGRMISARRSSIMRAIAAAETARTKICQ